MQQNKRCLGTCAPDFLGDRLRHYSGPTGGIRYNITGNSGYSSSPNYLFCFHVNNIFRAKHQLHTENVVQVEIGLVADELKRWVIGSNQILVFILLKYCVSCLEVQKIHCTCLPFFYHFLSLKELRTTRNPTAIIAVDGCTSGLE